MQANIARTKFYKESNNLNLPEAKFMRLANLILEIIIHRTLIFIFLFSNNKTLLPKCI